MNKTYYILHGYNGSPDENWFPWLKEKLEKRGDKAIVPTLPNPDKPQLGEWLATLKAAIQENGEGVLIGHSLGGVLAMRYLEQGGHPEKIVLVAVPFAQLPNIPGIDNFLETPWDISSEQLQSAKFVVIGSEDDPYVPVKHIKSWANYSDVEPVLFKDRRHFGRNHAGQVQTEFPEILDYL
ncbi:MAG: alpha/beta fold hydrolase [Patescibacteria group bacterium]|jgi:hypothetical protein